LKAKVIFAAVLFAALFALFNHMVASAPPPPVPICDWTDVDWTGSLTQSEAILTTWAECSDFGVDGCYLQVASTLYRWDAANGQWVQHSPTKVSTILGPTCNSERNYTASVQLNLLIPNRDYCIASTVYNKTFGTTLIGTGYNYFHH
jgi:hypothetical protein